MSVGAHTYTKLSSLANYWQSNAPHVAASALRPLTPSAKSRLAETIQQKPYSTLRVNIEPPTTSILTLLSIPGVSCLNLKSSGRRGGEQKLWDWWRTLLIHRCRQKEEKIDWNLMRIIPRGAFICSDGPAACAREYGVLYICMICARLWFRVKGKHKGTAHLHDFLLLLTFFRHAVW